MPKNIEYLEMMKKINGHALMLIAAEYSEKIQQNPELINELVEERDKKGKFVYERYQKYDEAIYWFKVKSEIKAMTLC